VATISTAGKELIFEAAEYERRLGLVREAMKRAGLELLLLHSPENIYYVAGYHTLGYFGYQCLAIPREGAPLMIIRSFEESNVRTKCWVADFAGYADDGDPVDTTVAALRERGLSGKRTGIEKSAWFLTTAVFERLTAVLADTAWIDASKLVDRVRLVKSAAEIAQIRRAAAMCQASLRAGEAFIREGATENDVAAAMHQALIAAGSDYLGHPPLIASGPRTGQAFATWAGRRFQRGDIVRIEPGACSNRYHAAMMRTYSIGEPSPLHRAMTEASRAGLETAITTMRPGVSIEQVQAAVVETITKAGFEEYYRHRSGYSIGIGFPPDWGEGRTLGIREGESLLLQTGMTFHITPGVAIKTVVGVGVTETVVVTDHGAESLIDYPRSLQIR
jgi:Xaa-Pro dipeptidase